MCTHDFHTPRPGVQRCRHSFHSKVAARRSKALLTGTSAIYDRVEIRFGLGTTTAALEVGSLLDRKRHVVDVAVNLRRGLEGNGLSAYDTRDSPANDHLLARDHAGHPALLAHDDLGGLNVAFDLTIDLQNTSADDLQSLTNDLKVVSDDRFFAA